MLKFEELPEVNSERWLSPESLEGEVWNNVKGYEGLFKVSNYGRVKSLPRVTRKYELIIASHIGPRGYYEINIYLNGERVHKKVHRIVATSFLDNTENKPSIDHIDGNKLNNTLLNLRFVTNKENSNNLITKERLISACAKAKKKNSKAVAQIGVKGNVIMIFKSVSEASKSTGISGSSISSVARGRVAKTREGWMIRNITAGGYKWKYINKE